MSATPLSALLSLPGMMQVTVSMAESGLVAVLVLSVVTLGLVQV